MLDWIMLDLAEAAQVSASTVKRMEIAGPQPVSDVAYARVRRALETAGLRLLTGGDGGQGLWFENA